MNFYRELSRLGYRLQRCDIDVFGNPCEYKTFPIYTGGITNYFTDKDEVENYLRRVKATRRLQTTMDEEE